MRHWPAKPSLLQKIRAYLKPVPPPDASGHHSAEDDEGEPPRYDTGVPLPAPKRATPSEQHHLHRGKK